MAKRKWGGKRKGAGRKCKFYPPIKLFYKPSESKENLLRALDDLTTWVLGDKIDTRRAATVAHVLETTAKVTTPSLIEARINELEAEAHRTRKALADRIAREAEHVRSQQSGNTATTGSSAVDSKNKDPQRQTI
jgi:hypothetical protein